MLSLCLSSISIYGCNNQQIPVIPVSRSYLEQKSKLMIKYHSLKMNSVELEVLKIKYFLTYSARAKRPAAANSTQHSVLSRVNWLVVEE